MKEVELFPAIAKLYEEQEVFAEVDMYGKRPDVVVRDTENHIRVIEMKTSLNKQLLIQVYYWMNRANYVYIAVPKPKQKRKNQYLSEILAKGIGVIYVDGESAEVYREGKFREIHPSYSSIWDRRLIPAFKDEIGGSEASGGVLTMYKHMINQIKRFMMRTRKEYTAQELVKFVPEISDHYSNPVQSIRSALSDFEGDWCKKSHRGQRVLFKAQIKRTPIKKKFEKFD